MDFTDQFTLGVLSRDFPSPLTFKAAVVWLAIATAIHYLPPHRALKLMESSTCLGQRDHAVHANGLMIYAMKCIGKGSWYLHSAFYTQAIALGMIKTQQAMMSRTFQFEVIQV